MKLETGPEYQGLILNFFNNRMIKSPVGAKYL